MCTCLSSDPYKCWARRYGLNADATGTVRGFVENDGGPCKCYCHDEDECADEVVCAGDS